MVTSVPLTKLTVYVSLPPPLGALVSGAPTVRGEETSVTVSPLPLVALMVRVYWPWVSLLNLAASSSFHRSNQVLPLWLAEAVKPLPPLTVTTTLVTPLGWEMMPRRGKEALPSVRLW